MNILIKKKIWQTLGILGIGLAVVLCFTSSSYAIPDSSLGEQPVASTNNQSFVDPASTLDMENIYINYTLGEKNWTSSWKLTSEMPDFLPLRSLITTAGGTMSWKGDPGVAFFSVGNRTLAVCSKVKYIYIGQRTANGITWQKVYYLQPSKLISGTTYLNRQTFAHLGMTSSWDKTAQQLNISLNQTIYNSEYKAPTADELWSLIGADLKNNIPKSVTTFLGAKTTYFNPSNTNRTTNLRLAIKALNGATVAPGATFSFNKTVGPRTPARGYKEAIIFQQGTEQIGYGGGVCQVSSTLYNAVLAAKLKVVERHPHSLPVTYVSSDMDASVYYGSADFRFRNTTKGTVIIKASIGSNWIKLELYCKT